MISQVFLSSTFKALEQIRHKIFFAIQKHDNLKCISLSKAHFPDYAPLVLPEIKKHLERCSFFLFLIGPQYGSTYSHRAGCEQQFHEYHGKSYTEIEFNLALQRLTLLQEQYDLDIRRHLRVVDLVEQPAADENVARFRDFAAEECRKRGIDKVHKIQPKYRRDKNRSLDTRFLWEPIQGIVNNFMEFAASHDYAGLRNDVLSSLPLRSEDHIQIIGWQGIERADLHGEFLNKHGLARDQLAFLTAQGPFSAVPRTLRYYPRVGAHKDESPYLPFEFLFVDVETLPYHRSRGLIEPIYKVLADNFRMQIANKNSPHSAFICERLEQFLLLSTASGKREIYGLPVMFGFNETLIQQHRFDSDAWNGDQWLRLDEAIDRSGAGVGLWNNGLATLPILVFGQLLDEQNAGLASKHLDSVASFASWFENASSRREAESITMILEKATDQICRTIIGAGGAVRLLSELREVNIGLSMDAQPGYQLSVVFGASSANLGVMPLEKVVGIQALRPRKKGVFYWINTMTRMRTGDTSGRKAIAFVEHLLEQQTQRNLSKDAQDYIGLAVNARVLEEQKKNCHLKEAIETLRQVELSGVDTRLPTAKRPYHSTLEPTMRKCWTKIREAIVSAGSV